MYSPIYITTFLTFESATWLCFWLMTFVLWCFALVLFFGFLFSVPMLGWLHVSLGLELVYLRLAHVLVPVIVLVIVLVLKTMCFNMYTKEDDARQAINALDGCFIEELCSDITCLGRTLYFCVFCTLDL